MKRSRYILAIIFSLIFIFGFSFMSRPASADQEPILSQQTSCQQKAAGLFPTWYQYLPGTQQTNKEGQTYCQPQIDVTNMQEILLIGLAILDILMRVAAILAVIFVIVGSVKYITSQGSPEGTKNAKDTIINALVGLAITLIASGAISFIARAIGGH